MTARGTDLRAGRRVQLAELIRAEARQAAVASARAARLRAEVDAATRRAAANDGRIRPLEARAQALSGPAALAALAGPGVIVSLDDAPRADRGGAAAPARADAPHPDDLVVHEQDVQAVVNALWAGGARALAIMGKRVTATTAVRCVGNTLLLRDAVYSPPFVVTAVGSPADLVAALDTAPGVRLFRSYVDAFGLGYSVRRERRVDIPAYVGPVNLRAARRPVD
ncbi:MAG: DUF881 domain-containing protein [Mycobacteriales bacterium]|nr:DUF881 domain-containing protein [Frankia sp.]